MKEYQEEYLALLKSVTDRPGLREDIGSSESFIRAAKERSAANRAAVERGTALLRDRLFPVLDDILDAPQDEIDSLYEFAGSLMKMTAQSDVVLHYRIHLALLSYARHKKLRDMLIRELYLVGMSLYNMESMLSPSEVRLYSTRMRMCFSEAASYFDTCYADITDPEIRGYIHRSMGNVALGYTSSKTDSYERKLAAVTRSINILSDPDVRAMTPSLPWDLYLYKSHQERTSLMGYLRSGKAGPAAFAQVLESAQIVMERQIKAYREKNAPPQPRWQYSYMCARYHCGAMKLEDMLEGFYALSLALPGDDFSGQSMFTHLSLPAMYLEYTRNLPASQMPESASTYLRRMTDRAMRWLVRAPSSDENEAMMFYLRQFLYSYREKECGRSFYEVLQTVFAARHPVTFLRVYIAGAVARRLVAWAAEDCPEKLVGLRGCGSVSAVIFRTGEIEDLAERAARAMDAGMVHFFHMERSACRGLFEEEEALLQLHAQLGAWILRAHSSTRDLADAALCVHRSWDERGGYPMDCSPKESPIRQIIELLSVADALSVCCSETSSRWRPERDLEQIWSELRAGRGTRYAPYAVDILSKPERREELARSIPRMLREGELEMYSRLK